MGWLHLRFVTVSSLRDSQGFSSDPPGITMWVNLCYMNISPGKVPFSLEIYLFLCSKHWSYLKQQDTSALLHSKISISLKQKHMYTFYIYLKHVVLFGFFFCFVWLVFVWVIFVCECVISFKYTHYYRFSLSSEKKVSSGSILTYIPLPLFWWTAPISSRFPHFMHKVWVILRQISALGGKKIKTSFWVFVFGITWAVTSTSNTNHTIRRASLPFNSRRTKNITEAAYTIYW